jgi:anti-anti-sigma factor
MEIAYREKNDFKVVDIRGNLDTTTAPILEGELDKLVEQNTPKIVVNLKELNYVSSSGLRVFLKTAKQMMPRKGSFYLCEPNETVKDILKISGFDTIIKVFDNLDQATA